MTINKIKGYRNYLNLTQEGMGQKFQSKVTITKRQISLALPMKKRKNLKNYYCLIFQI